MSYSEATRILMGRKFTYVIVGVIFVFAWVNFLVSLLYFRLWWLLLVIGMLFPLVLLVRVVQYKDRRAYGVTLAIFVWGIADNILRLRDYLEEYNLEKAGRRSYSYSLSYEEMAINLILMSSYLLAIFLMNRGVMTQTYHWRGQSTFKLLLIVPILCGATWYLRKYI